MSQESDSCDNKIIKKKRGRKPKNNSDVPKEPKVLKKRGRKPTGRIIHIQNCDISNLKNDDNCIVAHIPLSSNDIETTTSKYNNSNTEVDSNELSLETYSLGNNNTNNSFNDKYINHLEEENLNLQNKIKELESSTENKDIFYSDYSVEKLESKVKKLIR